MDERVWFFVEGPSQMGPVTRDELLAALRRLPPGTLVWRDGLPSWMPAESVSELAPALYRPAGPPPLPPRPVYPAPTPRRTDSGSGMKVVIVAAVLAVLVLVGIPVIGIVAAIAIPSLLRARVSANEAAAIGDVRTVISAQAAYQSMNRGFYAGRPECLSRPSGCIAGYDGPTFIDPAIFRSPKNGYVRELVVGTAAPPNVSEFAFIAIPAEAGKTGVRGFCGDASGRVCALDGGTPSTLYETTLQGAKCSSLCADLR